jgi:hypothetical protein
MKLIVIGFPKCGQHSLVRYLLGRGYDVKREDIIWRSTSPQEIKERYPDRLPVIITREPVEMIWSSYWYWPYHDIMTFEEYLDYEVKPESSLGTESPIDHADYSKFIRRFPKALVLELEEMVKNPNFRRENETPSKPEISNHEREMIEERLDS